MPAVSRSQQKFFGIVRAIQKGEMAPTTPETAKAAANMKKSDVKDFASTKHKKLPEKKDAKEESNPRITKKTKKTKKMDEETKKTKKTKKMDEETKYDRYDREKKKFAKADQRMKFGKFYSRAKEAQTRLRKGEVKKWDKELGRYVSNKE